MIAVLLTIYTAIVLVLFKLKLVKPRPYPIALIVVGGIFIVGGVVVAWVLSAPISPKLVTSQYVVQLVSYVKGQDGPRSGKPADEEGRPAAGDRSGAVPIHG